MDHNSTNTVRVFFGLAAVRDEPRSLYLGDVAQLQRFRLAPARSMREAIDKLSRQTFDFIVYEQALPGIDGFNFVRLVRSGRNCDRHIPIYLISEDTITSTFAQRAAEFEVTVWSRDDVFNFSELISSQFEERPKPSLLIIEDDLNAADIARRALDPYFMVEHASTGERGLEAWLATRHQLILLDLMLPDISGQEVLRKVRATKEDQPILVITADDTKERYNNLMGIGADDFIGKPFDPNTLVETCRAVLTEKCIVTDLDRTRYHTQLLSNIGEDIWRVDHDLALGDSLAAKSKTRHALMRYQRAFKPPD